MYLFALKMISVWTRHAEILKVDNLTGTLRLRGIILNNIGISLNNFCHDQKLLRNITIFLNLFSARVFSKSPFLTGFGLGFLAFGLKKLLLPLFIGAQIIKSILIAMFLPSILGSVGKLVGKGTKLSFYSCTPFLFSTKNRDTTITFNIRDNK